MMTTNEYLVSYGRGGEFGRFRPAEPLRCRRGDRVIVRSPQGLEIGTVLCPAVTGHAPFLSRTALGELLRCATETDLHAAEVQRQRGQRIFEQGRQLTKELNLPLEIVDVDVLLAGDRALIYHLCKDDCDYRPLVSTLARTYDLLIIMQNLTLPADDHVEEEHGCGKPECGKTGGGGGCSTGGGGGCSTCGTGGGCSAGAKKEDVTSYLLGLRQAMERRARTPLL